MGHLRVSVVISTLDRASQLERTLQSLSQLRYPAFEVVAVPGPCRDRTLEVLERFAPTIRIDSCPEPNLAMSRNIGIAKARGDIVAFLDDDAIPEPDWLDRLASGFDDPKVGGVGGFIRDRDGVRFQHQVIIADRLGEAEKFPAMPPEFGPHRFFSPTGTNVAVRREALLSIGGFDEEYAYFLDETDVNLRLVEAGWRLVSIPDAEVHHKFAESRLRGADRVPLSLYLIARSKSYFCWVNGSGLYSAETIAHELRRFQEEHRVKIERFVQRRKIDAATARRLMGEVEQGVADGARDAGSPRRLLSPAAVAAADDPFLSYTKPARDPLLRVCFASRHPWQHEATRKTALELAARGHEVTVIHLGEGHAPSVEFRDGIWLHGVVPRHMPAWWPATWTAPWPTRSWFAAAVADEVRRIQPRRRLQILVGPSSDIGAIERLHRLGIPVMAATAGPMMDRMVEAVALHGG